MTKPSLAEQIRCVERELTMRSRVYAGLVDRRKMSPAEAEREIATMGAVLTTLKACEQLADCLTKSPLSIAGENIELSVDLAKQIAAQLRGGGE